MSDKKKETPAEGEAAPKGKKKLLLFVIIGVVVLVLVVGGVIGFLMLKKKPVDEEDPDAEPSEEVVKDKGKKKAKGKDGAAVAPTYYKFDKPFTVKLQSTEQESYLQTEVQMRLLDAATVDILKAADPELKHKIMLALLGKSPAELNTAQGVQRLSNEIRDLANQVVGGDGGKKKKAAGAEPTDEADPDAPVQAVLFTTFIIQ